MAPGCSGLPVQTLHLITDQRCIGGDDRLSDRSMSLCSALWVYAAQPYPSKHTAVIIPTRSSIKGYCVQSAQTQRRSLNGGWVQGRGRVQAVGVKAGGGAFVRAGLCPFAGDSRQACGPALMTATRGARRFGWLNLCSGSPYRGGDGGGCRVRQPT